MSEMKTDRRSFIKSSAGAAAAVALVGNLPQSQAAEKKTVSDHNKMWPDGPEVVFQSVRKVLNREFSRAPNPPVYGSRAPVISCPLPLYRR